jgi:phosphoglycerate dehydrogenase-like enzyme
MSAVVAEPGVTKDGTVAIAGGQRMRRPSPGEPVTVVFGRPRFTPDLSWEDIPGKWTGHLKELARLVAVEHTGHNDLGARLLGNSSPVHVVVPLTSPVTAPMIEHGSFGLIHQFGTGTDAIDLDAAARCGVLVGNMPGLNAVPVAEHAVAMLLALAHRLREAPYGFRPGHWGEPGGRSLAGSTATVIGLGAVGTEICRRLDAFGITVIGVRRTARPGVRPPVPRMRVVDQGQLHTALAASSSVIIAASQRPGQPPVIDGAALRALRPGSLLVNVARGGLLDDGAALSALDCGRLAGLGLDVFPQEPYPPDGPLAVHPRVIATAHTAALTESFYHDAAERLGEAIFRWIAEEPLDHLVVS